MVIDCNACAAPRSACADCLVTAILGPRVPVELVDAEVTAVDALVRAGLVRPLRLEPVAAGSETSTAAPAHRSAARAG